MPEFRPWFEALCGVAPYPYQERVAEALLDGRSAILRAPTGAGKTRAAIVPFLLGLARRTGFARLLYVLPMRTLAQGIHREAFDLARRACSTGDIDLVMPDHARHDIGDVRLQTGEAPGDPFFSEGRIVVATYDQLLSGLLHAPYGASERLHNINGAAIAGALVVFDEFHLMEIRRAFMTAVAFAKWYDGMCQTLWMTATATAPVVDVLKAQLGCEEVALDLEEEAALPSVGSVARDLDWMDRPLDAASVLNVHNSRTIVICNTVRRAQEMAALLRRSSSAEVVLLHSRFFQNDRREREQALRSVFGRDGEGGAILVATQVVEAGLDISCEHLWTELCPMNSLVQRAGRCARFPGERGTVHVRSAPSTVPYARQELEVTASVLPARSAMTPRHCRTLVERVHAPEDAAAVQATTLASRLRECRDIVKKQVARVYQGSVVHLIREADDSVFVIIREAPPRDSLGYERARVGRRGLIGALAGLRAIDGKAWKLTGWDEKGPTWDSVGSAPELLGALFACLHPDVCRYDHDGMLVGVAGSRQSGVSPLPERPGYAPYRKESWLRHAEAVVEEALLRLDRDGLHSFPGLARRWGIAASQFRRACGRAAGLHDLGKLQCGWQSWAIDRQQRLGAPCGSGEFLAHTDSGCVEEELTRPPHAAAGAVIAEQIRGDLARDIPELLWDPLLAAIIAHHGGWLDDREVHPVDAEAMALVVELLGTGTARSFPGSASARRALEGLDIPEDLWPLASVMSRIVRLSDQRATADWCANG